MIYSTAQQQILVILSDEMGHSNKELSEIVYGNINGKGNISRILSDLRREGKKIADKKVVLAKFGDLDYPGHKYWINKDKDVFNSIVSCLKDNVSEIRQEVIRINDQLSEVIKYEDWKDNTIKLILEFDKYKIDGKHHIEILDKFIFSEYTGQIIKQFGIDFVCSSIPKLDIDKFVDLVDGAYQNGYINTIDYISFILSYSKAAQQIFRQKSPIFSDFIEVLEDEAREEENERLFDLSR